MPTYCCVHKTHDALKSFFEVPKNLEIKILLQESRIIKDAT